MKFSKNAQIELEIHYITNAGKKNVMTIEMNADFKDSDYLAWVEWVPKKKTIQVIQ